MTRTRTWASRIGLLALLALIWSKAPAAEASPGHLDRSFGRNGKVGTGFTPQRDLALGVAIQLDGRIVAAGTADSRRFALSRYRRNGRLDHSFGGDGKVSTRLLRGLTLAYAMAIQPDGKIVAVGSTANENAFALARYRADGTLDPTFGEDGRVATRMGDSHSFALDVAIQPDGKIVVAGTAEFSRFALIRYEPNGDLDPSFGDGGIVTTDVTTGTDMAFGLAIQPDGSIVVAGRGAGGQGRFAMARYEPDGTPDISFGKGGVVLTDFTGRHDAARDVEIRPNGRIVVAGFAGRGSQRGSFALARYTPDGGLDPAFGSGGKVVTRFTRGQDLGLGLAIDDGGRIVVVGHAGGTRASPRDHRFAVARYRPRGILDPSFGRGGRLLVNFADGDDWAQDVAIQADGRIVAAGQWSRRGGDFALIRLQAS